MVDIEKLVEELNSADLFLRNRAKCVPSSLNEYDTMLLQDAAKACNEAARILEKSTFVPFAIETLHMAGMKDKLLPVVVLQTIAANLGSMVTPIGNPQNIYLYFLLYIFDLLKFSFLYQ